MGDKNKNDPLFTINIPPAVMVILIILLPVFAVRYLIPDSGWVDSLLYTFTGFLVIFYFFICYLVIRSITAMQEGLEITLVNIPEEHPEVAEGMAVDAVWASENGFEPEGTYRNIFSGNENVMAMFIDTVNQRRFVRYQVMDKIIYDFITQFPDDCGLTTSTTKDGLMMPKPPGGYIQTFDDDLDTLYQKHIEAEMYIKEHARTEVEPLAKDIIAYIKESSRKQVEYVMSIPLWQLRGGYWFFIRRYKEHKKSIQKQHQSAKLIFKA